MRMAQQRTDIDRCARRVWCGGIENAANSVRHVHHDDVPASSAVDGASCHRGGSTRTRTVAPRRRAESQAIHRRHLRHVIRQAAGTLARVSDDTALDPVRGERELQRQAPQRARHTVAAGENRRQGVRIGVAPERDSGCAANWPMARFPGCVRCRICAMSRRRRCTKARARRAAKHRRWSDTSWCRVSEDAAAVREAARGQTSYYPQLAVLRARCCSTRAMRK